jgi:hypothetical protein
MAQPNFFGKRRHGVTFWSSVLSKKQGNTIIYILAMVDIFLQSFNAFCEVFVGEVSFAKKTQNEIALTISKCVRANNNNNR